MSFAAVGGSALPAGAASLYEDLSALVSAHPRIQAAHDDVKAAENRARIALGEWFPELSVDGDFGNDDFNAASGSEDTNEFAREAILRLTQQLWDFGATNAQVRRARRELDLAKGVEKQVRQSVLLEAVTAHLEIVRARDLLRFAKDSENSIKRQANLEDALVKRGSGFSTDVLQAKRTLAGAQARRVQAQGDLRTALNRYRAVFGDVPADVDGLKAPSSPARRIPADQETLIGRALAKNPDLAAARIGAEIARENEKQTRAEEFFPELNLFGELRAAQNDDGVIGTEVEQTFGVELSYSFNLGLTSVNALEASQDIRRATENRVRDARSLVEEQARNAWDNLQTARENAAFLRNQSVIAEEFLNLARRERTLGNRSLIDVLTGEIALIEATSNAASAETDVAIAVFDILSVIGELEPGVFKPEVKSEGDRGQVAKAADKPFPDGAVTTSDALKGK